MCAIKLWNYAWIDMWLIRFIKCGRWCASVFLDRYPDFSYLLYFRHPLGSVVARRGAKGKDSESARRRQRAALPSCREERQSDELPAKPRKARKMHLRKTSIFLAAMLSLLLLASCAVSNSNGGEDSPAEAAGSSAQFSALKGKWCVGALYYKNNLIDIHDVPSLEGLWDDLLILHEDGSFFYSNIGGTYEGEFTKYEQEGNESYLLKSTLQVRSSYPNYIISGSEKDIATYEMEAFLAGLSDGETAFEFNEEDISSSEMGMFLVTLLDDGNTLELNEFDSATGKAKVKADDDFLPIFVKGTSSEYIQKNKTPINADNADNAEENRSTKDQTTSAEKDGSTNSQEEPSKPSSTSSISSATTGEKNALESALDYLDCMAFSYEGLIEQLEFEGFTNEEATYGADNCGANWNEQAARMAREYLDVMSFSYSGLVEQLEFEGFTHSQAEYGASEVY